MKEVLRSIVESCAPLYVHGKVADYIPELSKADPEGFCLAVTTVDGERYIEGDANFAFSMQSVSKVVTLALALEERGFDAVFSAVGMSATADPFNSIFRLAAHTSNVPRNPMINSGAIVTVSLLPYEGIESKVNAVLSLTRRMASNPDMHVNERVYRSEKNTSDRNRALAYFLRSAGRLKGDVEDILDVYFRNCGIWATAGDLSVIGATFACDGVNPVSRERVLSPKVAQTVRALMVTCGMYDGSGEYAVKVGIPSKSGVGGGIMGAISGKMGIGVVSPPLDSCGNSVVGVAVLQEISQRLNLRVL